MNPNYVSTHSSQFLKIPDGFLLLDEDPVANTTPEDDDTAVFETTPDPEEVEAVTEAINIADNLVEDEVIPQLVLEEEKEVTLKITEFSDSKIVFRESSPILGLGCEAASEVDNNIRYMWTKNGRFIDTANNHVTFETSNNGENLMKYEMCFTRNKYHVSRKLDHLQPRL